MLIFQKLKLFCAPPPPILLQSTKNEKCKHFGATTVTVIDHEFVGESGLNEEPKCKYW